MTVGEFAESGVSRSLPGRMSVLEPRRSPRDIRKSTAVTVSSMLSLMLYWDGTPSMPTSPATMALLRGLPCRLCAVSLIEAPNSCEKRLLFFELALDFSLADYCALFMR